MLGGGSGVATGATAVGCPGSTGPVLWSMEEFVLWQPATASIAIERIIKVIFIISSSEIIPDLTFAQSVPSNK